MQTTQIFIDTLFKTSVCEDSFQLYLQMCTENSD